MSCCLFYSLVHSYLSLVMYKNFKGFLSKINFYFIGKGMQFIALQAVQVMMKYGLKRKKLSVWPKLEIGNYFTYL